MNELEMSTRETGWQKFNYEYLRPLLAVEDPREISLFDRSSLLFLAITLVWYLSVYFTHPFVPSSSPSGPIGWWGWWDQGQYYKCASDLAHGDLKPENYWFGYPILGVPFYWLMPRHPFLIPDSILVLTMAGSFFVACRHHVGRLEAWGLVVIFLFIDPFMRGSLVLPWNTLPAYAAIYLSACLLLFQRPKPWQFALCAALIGEALFSRPTELWPLACIYLAGIFRLAGWTDRAKALGFLGLAGAAVAVSTLALNLHLYGQWSSPYMATEGRKFHLANYGLKVYQLICDGRFLTGQGALPDMNTLSLGERSPAFLCCLPGAVYLVKNGGSQMWGLLLAMGSSVAFYLTYSTFANMPFFWTYGSYHYIWWIIPWLAFFTYLTFRQARLRLSSQLFFGTLIAPPLLFLLVGFKAESVAATDFATLKLACSTNYSDQSYTIDLTAPDKLDALDVRLEFQTPPSYHGLGTSVVYDQKVKVWVNGKPQMTMPDYFMSEDGPVFDFSFLVHGLALNTGDTIRIQFTETEKPVLARASLLDVVPKFGRFSR